MSNKDNKTTLDKFKDIITHIVLIILVFLINLPLISMVGTAVKDKVSALTSTSLFPGLGEWRFNSFVTVINSTTFLRNIGNSAIIAITVTLLCILIASMAGYAISRFKGRVFSFYSMFLLLLQMFPGMLLLMPLYVIYNKLGLVNTLGSVILSYTTMNLAFSIWMMKGFFDSIPRELEQAGIVDGCTRFQAFYKIVMPISLPGLATVGIFTFINCWNEYTLASIFLRKDEILTMTVGLQKFVQQYSSDWPLLMAASTIATIPTIIFLVFTQKFLIEGMTAGAVKG